MIVVIVNKFLSLGVSMYRLSRFFIVFFVFQNVVGSEGLRQRSCPQNNFVLNEEEMMEKLKNPEMRVMYNLGHRSGFKQGEDIARELSKKKFEEGYKLAVHDRPVRDCCWGCSIFVLACIGGWNLNDILNPPIKCTTVTVTPMSCNCKANSASVKPPKSAIM